MHRLAALSTGLMILTIAAAAASQEAPDPPPPAVAPAAGGMKQPVAYVARPLTLPAMTLSPQLDVQIGHFEFDTQAGTFSNNAITMELGASFGVLDDLTVEARPLGILTGDPDTDYTRFQIGATYRFLKGGPVEIGARFRFQIDNDATLAFNPSLPVRIRAGDIVRIDTGVNFTGLIPTSGGDAVAQLGGIYTDYLRIGAGGIFGAVGFPEAGVPVDVAFQIVEPAFVGLTTGFGIADFSNGDSTFMPLGLFAGGTVPGDQGPLVDIGASFGFPAFLIGTNNDNPTTEVWSIGITGRGFLYL